MTNDTTAPERIWAQDKTLPGDSDKNGYWQTGLNERAYGFTEYVRADALEAAQARIAELEEGLTLIERIYYMEGKPAAWRAAHMNGTAREAQNGESYSCKRLFPRAALEGKG